MVELTNKEFFQDLDQTIAAQLFEQTTYPWEILPIDQRILYWKLDQHYQQMNMIR